MHRRATNLSQIGSGSFFASFDSFEQPRLLFCNASAPLRLHENNISSRFFCRLFSVVVTRMTSALPVWHFSSSFDEVAPHLNISSASGSTLSPFVVSGACNRGHCIVPTRIVLTAKQAEEIFRMKISMVKMIGPKICTRASYNLLRGKSVSISSEYNVSPKTIRDIWNRRTWQRATCHLWQYDDVSSMKEDFKVKDSTHFQVYLSLAQYEAFSRSSRTPQ
jgi:hypothetical protein